MWNTTHMCHYGDTLSSDNCGKQRIEIEINY